MAEANERNWLSVAEVAQLLGVSRTTVWRWIRAGRLPARRIGPRTLRVERGAVDALGARSDHARHEDQTAGFLSDAEAEAMIAYIYRGRDESLAVEIERDRERGWLTGNGGVGEEPESRDLRDQAHAPASDRASDLDGGWLMPVDKERAARKRAELFKGYDPKAVVAAIHEAAGSWADLDRQTEAAQDNDGWRLTPVDKERAARKRAELFKDYDPEKVRRALREYGGSWSDLDTDAMITELYRARDEGTRPADQD